MESGGGEGEFDAAADGVDAFGAHADAIAELPTELRRRLPAAGAAAAARLGAGRARRELQKQSATPVGMTIGGARANRDGPTRRAPMTVAQRHATIRSVVYHVYILASASGVLYVGVTNYLERRVREHKEKLVEGFTKKYEVTRLVHFEPHNQIKAAISREKQIKNWRREKKLALIRKMNPTLRDLSEDFHK